MKTTINSAQNEGPSLIARIEANGLCADGLLRFTAESIHLSEPLTSHWWYFGPRTCVLRVTGRRSIGDRGHHFRYYQIVSPSYS